MGVIGKFSGELAASPTVGDFTAAGGADQVAGHVRGHHQIGEAAGGRFDENDLGSGSHGVGALHIEGGFKLPAWVVLGPGSAGIDGLKASLGQSELGGK